MGGAVNLAVRMHDGKVIAREGYTSGICPLFKNDRFFEYDIFHIQSTLMHSEEKVTLSPDGYGLVFGDFVTKKIHSCQGYTNPSTISGAGLSLDLGGARLYSSAAEDDYSDWLRFQRLFKKGYIASIRQWNIDIGGTVEIPPPDTIEDVIALLKSNNFHGSFVIEVDGWEIIDYDDSKAGMQQFLQAIIDDGVEVDAQTLRDWDTFINDRWKIDE